jgi:CRP/FNR family cyclic AMP-dependent transcriptional regulator
MILRFTLREMNPANLFDKETDTIHIAAGEVLFKTGDAPDGMFVVLEGAMEVMIGETVVEHSVRGAILGELALIDNSPRVATVVAKETCKLVKIDQRRFNFLIQQNPFFATHVMKVLADRLRHMDQIIGQAKP